ncbi:MAG: carbonic anhydrase [Phycisphaerales bacterium]
MAWNASRTVLACGIILAAGSLVGSTLALNPPDEQPAKRPAAPPKSGAPKEPAAEKPSERSEKHEPAPPAETRNDAADRELASDETESPLKRLQAGNERWVKEKPAAPNTTASRREETSSGGQKPFATILTCADSRIPVERVFDCGVGDVFVVRVAGNVIGADASGTIEYGAEHLSVPLLVVMGHTKCGAVAAAASGGDPGGNVSQLVEKIAPAVQRAKNASPDADEKQLASLAVRENVMQSIFDLLRTSAAVRELVRAGKIEIVGAVYDVGSGAVEWIGEHPWQDALVDAFDAGRGAKQRHASADAEHGH